MRIVKMNWFSKISLLFLIIGFPSFYPLDRWIENKIPSDNYKAIEEILKIEKQAKLPKESKSLKARLDYGKIPIYFIPNRGHKNKKVLFYAKTSKYTLWLTRDGLVFDSLIKKAGTINNGKHSHLAKLNSDPLNHKMAESLQYERDFSSLIFLNSNKKQEIIPLDKTAFKVNYFRGQDKSEWRTNIPTSKAVLYKELYENIDLKIYGVENQVEYDFIVKPGGEVSDICFKYQDVKKTELDKEGHLFIKTRYGKLCHTKPTAYQIVKGKKINIKAEFRETGENIYSFETGAYDIEHTLIIDPLVGVYSKSFGGSENDFGQSLTVDSSGAAIVTGYTYSNDFPLKKALQKNIVGNTDAFITKINPEGTDLVYSTYLGGSNNDYGKAVTLDAKGAVYVTGYTNSIDFPVKKRAFQNKNAGGVDIFIVIMTKSGKKITYSTYLGGSSSDYSQSIALNPDHGAIITGYTNSNDFPLKKAFQKKNKGRSDAIIAKMNNKLSGLMYSTYLGGTDNDRGYSVAVNSSGEAHVTGETYSTDFFTKKPFQKKNGGKKDAFFTKLKKKGNPSWSTYMGGSDDDHGTDILVDTNGSSYSTGITQSDDFPIRKATQKNFGGISDAFVTMIKANGKLFVSTYLGGSSWDFGNAIAQDDQKMIIVAGNTNDSGFLLGENFEGAEEIGSIDEHPFIFIFDRLIREREAYKLEGASVEGLFVEDFFILYLSFFFVGNAWSPDSLENAGGYANSSEQADVIVLKYKYEK